MNHKYGIVIAVRSDSSRIPRKAFARVNGMPLLEHLLRRLKKTNMDIYLAVPTDQKSEFDGFRHLVTDIVGGSKDDVLYRVHSCAIAKGLTAVVRVTADKLFVSPDTIIEQVRRFGEDPRRPEYASPHGFVDGSRFEIITTDLLARAIKSFRNVEFISYAVIACAQDTMTMVPPVNERGDARLLIDFPEDIEVIDTILAAKGNDCTLAEALTYIQKNTWIKRMNKLPAVTVYTCARDVGPWIQKTMGSVASQHGFRNMEYLLIDDQSSDRTPELMARFTTLYNNVRFIRNADPMGLAASSNLALSMSKGKWIIRLDGDDYFTSQTAIRDLVSIAESNKYDAVYPANFFGSKKNIQGGEEKHHVGGALFNSRAMQAFKFRDGINGFDGLDFFMRARSSLNVGYFPSPTFFYRQREGSLSQENTEERMRIKESIMHASESLA